MEQLRRLLLHCVHIAPVLYQRRSLLRHFAAAHVPDENHAEKSGRHVGQHLDVAGSHFLSAHHSRMVSFLYPPQFFR